MHVQAKGSSVFPQLKLSHQFNPESSKFNPRKQNYMNQSYFFFILLYSKQCY